MRLGRRCIRSLLDDWVFSLQLCSQQPKTYTPNQFLYQQPLPPGKISGTLFGVGSLVVETRRVGVGLMKKWIMQPP